MADILEFGDQLAKSPTAESKAIFDSFDAMDSPRYGVAMQSKLDETNSQLDATTKLSLTGHDQSRTGDLLATAAGSQIGERVWSTTFPAAALDGGRLSSAAAVSSILSSAGIDVHEASVRGLQEQLTKQGFTAVSLDNTKPGDVIIGIDRNGIGDCGIVGHDGAIYGSLTTRGGIWGKASNGRFDPLTNSRWSDDAAQLRAFRGS